jgi:hypothetical protein
MPSFPAICQNCGLFFPSGFQVGKGVRLTGNRAECPRCGSLATVPDGGLDAEGNFFFVNQVYRVLNGPAVTPADLHRLVAILNQARVQQAEPEQVVEQIQREAPALAGIAKVIVPQDPAAFWQMVGAVSVIAMALLSRSPEQPTQSPPPRADTPAGQVVTIPQHASPPIIVPKVPVKAERTAGRNDPCPCGSGKKYKHCHGDPAKRAVRGDSAS